MSRGRSRKFRIADIELELLRGGPPHNQLVSPITEYLALCGDASPHVLRLPFEHRDLTDRLSMLRYDAAPATTHRSDLRSAELQRLGRDVGALLGSVPSFAAELTGQRPDPDQLVHLRLVLAGNELALVPWEVAHIPVGLPGAGLPLLLNPSAPVSLTREVRGASQRTFHWDRRPSVLFVTADSSDFPAHTVEAHLLALLHAVEPWAYEAWKDNGWRVEHPIEVIERATLEQIRECCARRQFTHVHVLAHGQPLSAESDARFGLRLHDSSDPGTRDIVSGERLAQALRVACGRGGPSNPLFVTLATCDSGNQASVIVPGGSIAHELHQYGIPWVVASQLPLTVGGSVVLVEDLYRHLLRGDDPRKSLRDLRSHLAVRYHDRHDWATLVVYASMPGDFGAEAAAFRRRAAIAIRNRAYTLVDLLMLSSSAEKSDDRERDLMNIILTASEYDADPKRAREAIEDAKNVFSASFAEPTSDDESPAIIAGQHARFGALIKRLAELQWRHPQPGDDWIATLEEAREQYRLSSAFGNRADHWATGQLCVLNEVLNPTLVSSEPDPLLWNFACYATVLHLESQDSNERMWALATLADLAMVAIARNWPIPGFEEKLNTATITRVLNDMVSAGLDALWPTFRQFWRYKTWWVDERWDEAAREGYRCLASHVWERLVPRARPAETIPNEAPRAMLRRNSSTDFSRA